LATGNAEGSKTTGRLSREEGCPMEGAGRRGGSWRTAANGVTLLRLLLTAPLIWAMVSDRGWLAVALFLIAAASDGVDGYLARSRGESSPLGKLLDPVADKVLGIAVLATLTLHGRLPSWMFWALAAKEALQLLGGLILLAAGRPVPAARLSGKAATVVLFTGFALAMVGWPLGTWVTGAGVLLSLGAGVDYAFVAAKGVCSRSKPAAGREG